MSRYLFEHLDMLAERIKHAPALIVFLNIDHALAPPADFPERAELSPTLRQMLRALAQMDGVNVAIISSRKLSDLRALLGLLKLSYAGNNGLEVCTPDSSFTEPAAVSLQETVGELAAELARKLQPVAGVWVENKDLALCVHYRQAPEEKADEIRGLVHTILADSKHPFVLTQGDKTYDIGPRVHWTKGDAVRWLKERLGRQDALAIYIGDNPSDEEAFAALPDGITIRVGSVPETAAQYHVNDPAEVEEFLGWLANVLADKSVVQSRPAPV
ncbi:MAG TPA: trehalose-phosphatase [Gemmataceae bacterium]|jgi:trehalose-phosphatase|nr:trehalose-phosphatase [Gemmataceae bacterium]